jgi:hypothetical protein
MRLRLVLSIIASFVFASHLARADEVKPDTFLCELTYWLYVPGSEFLAAKVVAHDEIPLKDAGDHVLLHFEDESAGKKVVFQGAFNTKSGMGALWLTIKGSVSIMTDHYLNKQAPLASVGSYYPEGMKDSTGYDVLSVDGACWLYLNRDGRPARAPLRIASISR